MTIESTQRKHAQTLATHQKALEHRNQQCGWLKLRVDSCYARVDSNTSALNSKLDMVSGVINEITGKITTMDDAIEALKNMTAQSFTALNSLTSSSSHQPQTEK